MLLLLLVKAPLMESTFVHSLTGTKSEWAGYWRAEDLCWYKAIVALEDRPDLSQRLAFLIVQSGYEIPLLLPVVGGVRWGRSCRSPVLLLDPQSHWQATCWRFDRVHSGQRLDRSIPDDVLPIREARRGGGQLDFEMRYSILEEYKTTEYDRQREASVKSCANCSNVA